MYNMNAFSLQLNLLTDELKDKLPPTDSRMRPDVRAWEEGKVDEASE
jgi:oxysterol-binding protein-related protein 3/6/7